MSPSLSLIVATKDRPAELRRLLASIATQATLPAEVLIVDASAAPDNTVVGEFAALNLVYIRHSPPSASAQRNAGIQACTPAASLIGFVDDDAEFEPGSMERMIAFWRQAPQVVLGASFNLRNYSLPGGQVLKRSLFARRLGLYTDPGSVAPSGWHSVFGTVEKTRFVDWLPSGAVVWRAPLLRRHRFDEFFDGYSYLEDLDFSYSIGREGRLAVVAEAGYRHLPSPRGRVSTRQFGRVEVRNRIYFVKKNRLSISLCFVGIGIRLAMTFWAALAHSEPGALGRALGNIESLLTGSRESSHGAI